MIKIDTSAAEKSFLIFNCISKQSFNHTELIKEYYNTLGILFLKKHIKYYGDSNFSEDFFLHLFNCIIKNKDEASSDNIFLKSIKSGMKHAYSIEKDFKKININEITDKAISLANLYLPNKISGEITIYLLYGIRGTGIVLDNEIAIDLCDNYLNIDGCINIENLINILAHELHHVEINKFLTIKTQHQKDSNTQLLIYFIGELISEGVAYFYLPSPYDKEGMLNENWNKNIQNIVNILYNIRDYIIQISEGKITNLNDIGYLFNDSLEGYTAGFIMCKIIHQAFGKDILINSLKDFSIFLQLYNKSVRIINSDFPEIPTDIIHKIN